MSRLVQVEGMVWCHVHGEVHDADTINPYGMGSEDWCDQREHRPIYWRARKGDEEYPSE